MLVLTQFVSGRAEAFTWTQLAVPVLSMPGGGGTTTVPYALGVGAPAVTKDVKAGNRLIMAFEAKITNGNPVDPLCGAGGTWAIGLASSADGQSWSVIDADGGAAGVGPLLKPNPTSGITSHDCVMAQPSVLWSSAANNKEMWVYYKAQDNVGGNFTGVGVMLVKFLGNGNFQSVTDHGVVLPITGVFGYSDVMQREDGTFYMLVQIKRGGLNKYDLFDATAPAETGPWTLSATAAMTPEDFNYTWAMTELTSPDLFCQDDVPGDGIDEIHAWVMGRTLVSGAVTSAGMGEAVSLDDGIVYSMQDPPEVAWANSSSFRHWSTVQLNKLGVQHFLRYTSEIGTAQDPRILFAYTDALPGFAYSQVVDDRCP